MYVPATPEYTRSMELVTYQDAVERVLTYWDRSNEGRDRYLARKAVADALRQMGHYRWKWYRGTLFLTTEPSYSEGTVQYQHTGGAVENQVTLDEGTWPANAAYGCVLIENSPYPIIQRVSDTVVQLSARFNPGKDIDEDTDYTWFRHHYHLPPDVIDIGDPKDVDKTTGGPDVMRFHPDRNLSIGVHVNYVPEDYPRSYAIERDPRYGGKTIIFSPPPKIARTYAMTCAWAPKAVKVERYVTGSITTIDGSTTVSGSGTSWTSTHVGCVLRVSEGTESPTSQYGGRKSDAEAGMYTNPAVLTRIVTKVNGSGELVLDQPADISLTGKGYVLSDWIDVDWQTCGTYFDASVDHFFGRTIFDIEQDQRRRLEREMKEEFNKAVDADAMLNPAPTGLTWYRGILHVEGYDWLNY